MTSLPDGFLKKMQDLLGEDYEAFRAQLGLPAVRGVRVNTLRCAAGDFLSLLGRPLKAVPFSPAGFYIHDEITGRHPLHHAGVIYFQEPSAMAAVTAAEIRPGMRVLDLCAAPGGKSTQAAALLHGEGLIVCNEIVPARARALLSNIERCGIANAAVTNMRPELLCGMLRGFFDVVLVDAPCSGEGMFRRDPAAADEWSAGSPAACAKRQLAILACARQAVRGNGLLVYSTCTFSPEENEGVVEAFLKENPDFEIEEIPDRFGRPARPDWAAARKEIGRARRIFPQDGGEGHFVARMRRISSQPCTVGLNHSAVRPESKSIFEAFYASQFEGGLFGELHEAGEQLFILPPGLPALKGGGLLRAGLLAGRIRQGRFEPAHALYMAAALRPRNALELPMDSPLLGAWLHGEAIEAPALSQGYVAVRAAGFPVGFGKAAGGVLKNHYPKGLRNL